MLKATIITGLQWGDEGKGKITDLIGHKFDTTIRFNGGNNAGHTVVYKKINLKLSLIPSAVLRGKKVLISQGVIINPQVLLDEIKYIEKLGVKVDLGIDPRCHVILPYHQALDSASENSKGDKKTGSLKLGIGFCYEDRTNRAGIRLTDLQYPKLLRSKLEAVWEIKKLRVTKTYKADFDLELEKVYQDFLAYGKKLKPYVLPIPEYVLSQKSIKKVLLETAQGFYLDFVFGSYPYTVAYNTIASSSLPDIGLPAQKLQVIGVVKAYTTRVGNGPFPAEQTNEIGEHMQSVGREIGTVSRRVRRCGWLDLPMIRFANLISGTSMLAITKLDVLSGLKEIKLVTHYELDNKNLDLPPINQELLDKVKVHYKAFPGWNQDISKIRKFTDLPKNCQTYLNYIEKQLQVSIKYISVGPDRKQTIIN